MNVADFQQELQTYLDGRLPDYLALLQKMVRINSFTANPEGVNTLGQLTADLFADMGFTREAIQSYRPQFGKHVVLTRQGSGEQAIGLVSHLDTVFPPEEEIQHDFAWREEGDRIYGPGTVDIKGGTVALYMMLDALRQFQPALFTAVTWIILLDASEEADADDFGALCAQRLTQAKARAALIFEGGEMTPDHTFKLVVARKGMALFHVAVEGKAAHAGSAHHLGANAIIQMADVVQKLAALTDHKRAVTVNVGVISGGTVTNRVPHETTADLEMRAFTLPEFETTKEKILALNGYSSVHNIKNSFACRVQVDVTRQTPPWPRNEGTDGLFAVWQAAAAELGWQTASEERGGLSDGNHFWQAVPTLDGLGPAGGNLHCSERSEDGSKEQEYCLKSSFVPKTVLNVTAVMRLLAGIENK